MAPGTKSNSRTRKSVTKTPSNGSPRHYALSELYLDNTNPRLGGHGKSLKTQYQVLDYIVKDFGVDDVLSSLAVNGYFQAEPLVGVKRPGGKGIRIAEGNRRLAACLILTGDERAKNQKRRTDRFRQIRDKHRTSQIDEVPVIVLENTAELFSYLGVRHIAASQPWDSFAKAAWVSKILTDTDLSLDDISEMIGDQHGTIPRTLEGFLVVNQLIQSGHFDPDNSARSGRGSNPEYPFSWVYTALGYSAVREWLALRDLTEEVKKNPLKNAKLKDGGDLFLFLFGDESKGFRPSIDDSREISELARLVADPKSRRLLKKGKNVKELQNLSKSPIERVSDNLFDAQEHLHEALIPISEGDISDEDADPILEPSKRVRHLAQEVYLKLREITLGDAE